jgi:hypothetical protein
MLSRYLFGEPTPPGGVRYGEQVVPGPCLHMLTYTARAVLPGIRSPLSSSCGPPRPARALAHGTYASRRRGLPKEIPA